MKEMRTIYRYVTPIYYIYNIQRFGDLLLKY